MSAALLQRESAQYPALSPGSTAGSTKPEIDEPRGFTIGLTAPGTGVFFLESVVYIVFGALGDRVSLWAAFDLAVHSDFLEVVGASVMAIGYLSHVCWSLHHLA